jgi:hypothetical protein
MKAFNKKKKLKHTTKPKLRYWESYQCGYDYEDYLEEYKRKDGHSITIKRCQGRYTFFWHLDAINRRNYKYKLKMGLL